MIAVPDRISSPLGHKEMKNFGLLILATALVLTGFSCKNKYAAVNVNVNATAQAAVNAAKTVNKTVVTKEAAVAAAKALFITQEGKGVDFLNGPCLSNSVLPDWVADVAHNPRKPVDDKAENQCSAYRDGGAHHYVELDPEGQLIRAE